MPGEKVSYWILYEYHKFFLSIIEYQISCKIQYCRISITDMKYSRMSEVGIPLALYANR